MMQEFVQQIENVVREATYDIHTALPGTIEAFDPASGMAVVKPQGTMNMKNGKKLSYPAIVKVPVMFPRGQNTVIAYPVNPGDGCMIIVSENDMKPWMSHGKETDSDMKFDLTNAVCIPGLYGEGNETMQKAQEENAIILINEDMELMLKKDGLSAEYRGSRITMEETAVNLACGGCSISLNDSGIRIKGNLDVDGVVSSLEGV